MLNILQHTHELLNAIGVSASLIKPVSATVLVLVSFLIFWAMYALLTHGVEPLIQRMTRATTIKWDDVIFRHKALRWVWAVILSLLAYKALPIALADYPSWSQAARVMSRIALILAMMMTVIECMKSLFLLIGDRENIDEIVERMHQAFDNDEEFVYNPSHSLKGLQQMLVIIIVGFSMILIVSTLIGRDPLIVLSGLGAMAAVLMLVFQDSILGLVAGVQITANDMLQPGDWIMAPKYGANGIVKEVTLAAVKIQNWDKTIITVPPYKLLSEGFQNWRGMILSKGRRVCRSINIDMTTVRFADKEEIARWKTEKWWGEKHTPGKIVNLTAFRMYLEHYLTEIPTFVPNMLFMIRELQPTADGLPLEIYFFTSRTEWKRYERVQADVIDMVLASLPEFGLRVYQHPSDIITVRDCAAR